MIKPRKMRWAGHVASMAQKNEYRIFQGKPEGERPLGRPRSRRRIILRWILERNGGMVGMDLLGSR
jgi:hypothetical protein